MYKERSLFKNAAEHLDLVVEGYTKLLGPEYWKTVDAANQRETINSTALTFPTVRSQEILGS